MDDPINQRQCNENSDVCRIAGSRRYRAKSYRITKHTKEAVHVVPTTMHHHQQCRKQRRRWSAECDHAVCAPDEVLVVFFAPW